MTITLTNITVWDTGERINLIINHNSNDRTIDASNWIITPGLADPHVHFRDPGQTHKETMITGSAAAAAGGYTHVLIMPNTQPAIDGQPVQPNEPGAQAILEAGYDNVIDYLQHYEQIHHVTLPVHYDLCVAATQGRMGTTPTNPQNWAWYMPGHNQDKDSAQIAHPITAISDDGSAIPTPVLREVFNNAKTTGLCIIEHCEHHDTGAVNAGPVAQQLGVPGIPEHTELDIVTRDIALAKETGVHVHFQHVSTAIACQAIREAKAQGLPITCETAPHYIALTDEDLLNYGTYAKMNPPLRTAHDRQAIIAAIADGTIDMIATDHAPHTQTEKEQGFLNAPNGIIGLECAYGVCHQALVDTGIISNQRLIELMSTVPARFMGHKPTDIAGLLNVSSRCATQRTLDLRQVEHPERVNLAILAPNEPWTIDPQQFHSKGRNTPFAGWQVTGKPIATIMGSRIASSNTPQLTADLA